MSYDIDIEKRTYDTVEFTRTGISYKVDIDTEVTQEECLTGFNGLNDKETYTTVEVTYYRIKDKLLFREGMPYCDIDLCNELEKKLNR